MNKPPYADFDPAAKFQAIQSIIASKLTRYPKAICSYSGGSDSDTMIDLIERTRKVFGDAYRYRQQYVEYRDRRRKEEREERDSVLNAWKPYLEDVSE